MILRGLASLLILGLLVLNLLLPGVDGLARGPERLIREDVESKLVVGEPLPPFELFDRRGRRHDREALQGHPVLLVFERSLDWRPSTKVRLARLARVFEATPELRIVWVMPDSQASERAWRFIDELDPSDRILFLSDPKSRLIRALGILDPSPPPVEQGVPFPTTLLLDRGGRIRFIDIREDSRFWLDPGLIAAALAGIEA